MKRFISLAAAAAMIFGAASCQKDASPGMDGGAKVSFSVVIPDNVTATKTISDGLTVDELKWEVYDHDTGKWLYDGTVKESAIVDNKKQFILELNLVSNLTYDILFWAQKSGTNHYDTSDLRDVRQRSTTVLANDETRDAFFGSLVFNTGANVATHNTIILKRPFAQINIASSPSDWQRARPFIEAQVDGKEHGLKSRMVIRDAYNRFNVLKGDVVDENSTVSITFNYNLAPASQDYDNYPNYEWQVMPDNYIFHNSEKYGWAAMNYVFAPKNGATSPKVLAYFVHSKNNDETALSKEIYSVPFKQNYRTNILGEIFTGGNKFTVIVDASFNTPDPGYTIADPLMLAFEHGGNITLNTNLDIPSSLVLKAGKKLTLDLNGKTITTTRDLWDPEDGVKSMISVQEGAELTIVDSKGTGAIIAKTNDAYTFDVRGGSKLTIEGGTYVGNITAVQVDEGTANIKGGHFSLAQLAPAANGGDARFTLNCIDDAYRNNIAKINVTGGSFVNFNPADNLAEGAGTRFVPTEGYDVTSVESEANGKTIITYTVAKTATVTE